MTGNSDGVRGFTAEGIEGWRAWDEGRVRIGPAVGKEDGGPLSAYYARFDRGATAALPAPWEEVWVVLAGSLILRTPDRTVTAGPGDLLHVPADSPGELRAEEDTTLACVSVPAH
ncbi:MULTISPECIES: cupin domain-containing protein [unclassified Nocardiopsis]|uniref:cupin domain-containing protein n=1 Tax=unclassified Nocardiopsis TaxID=2649073 RepID=UPI0034057F7D